MGDAKRGKTAQRADAITAHHLVEARLIVGEMHTIILFMPQVKYAGRKAAVLALDARVDEADGEIGILQSPAVVARVKPIDAVEIGACDRKIAGARTFPALRLRFAQGPERQGRRGGGAGKGPGGRGATAG